MIPSGLNYFLMVKFSAKRPLFSLAMSWVIAVLCSATGCEKGNNHTESKESKESSQSDSHPIKIVVLGSNPQQAESWTKAIRREFDALELGKVEFEFGKAGEFLDNPIQGDLIFYPPHLFGSLVKERLVRRIPDYLADSEAYAENDVLKQQRNTFCTHDKTRFAIPMGISSFFLLARVDVLKENGLTVPQTWSEYRDTCQSLAQLRQAGKLKGMNATDAWSPTLEPMHDDWLATIFYARCAGYVRTRGRYSFCLTTPRGNH